MKNSYIVKCIGIRTYTTNDSGKSSILLGENSTSDVINHINQKDGLLIMEDNSMSFKSEGLGGFSYNDVNYAIVYICSQHEINSYFPNYVSSKKTPVLSLRFSEHLTHDHHTIYFSGENETIQRLYKNTKQFIRTQNIKGCSMPLLTLLGLAFLLWIMYKFIIKE